jgi:c-di-GMP-binding flagellar brake protein YcgR
MWLDLDRRGVARTPVNLSCAEHLDGRRFPSVALDLSETGVAVRRLGDLGGTADPHAGVVELELALPGAGEAIRARAEARFRSVHRAGLRFLSMPARHQRLLREFLLDRRLRALALRRPWWRLGRR